MKKHIIKALLSLKMAAVRKFLWQPLEEKTRNPRQAQDALLLRIISDGRHTTFGKEHGFENIQCYEDYCQHVPVRDYEAFRAYIENQESKKLPHLNHEQPIMYAQTSGTTGKPKNIPILKSTVSQYRCSQHIAAYAIYHSIPSAYDGKILAITSPAVEGVMKTGTPFGAMSGLIYRSMPKLMREKYVLPAEVFEIRDYQIKYYEIAKLALAEKDISLIATANPSTLVKLDQVINENTGNLIEDIALINVKRARELHQIVERKGALVTSDIWPHLKVVATWTGGSCGVLVPLLKKRVPEGTRFVELGYLASEFRGGITIDVLRNRQIPALHENFLEFVEKECWQNQTPKFLRLHEIQLGRQYYIFATTRNGLYRYNINDIVKVTGSYNNTPTIEFVQKGKGVTNLTGEKLHEGQLVQAMTEMIESRKRDIHFFKMLGNPAKREYTLYVEQEDLDIRELDRRLCELNIEFDAKRKSGRLRPIRLAAVFKGTGETYKQHCLDNGQREGQFKMSYLQCLQDCSFDFSNHILGHSNEAGKTDR